MIISVAASKEELRLDLSPLLIYPPRVALQSPRSDHEREWELSRHE